MAVRIRKDGKIVCAAINQKEDGDLYIDDSLHYYLSVEKKMLVTTENDYHMTTGGEWWWKDEIPKGLNIDVV